MKQDNSDKVFLRELSRAEKEKRIKDYFNQYKSKPKFRNFSFSSKSSLHDTQLKYVGAFSFLNVFSSNKFTNDQSNDIKDRTYFFIFLKGRFKDFNRHEYTSELYDICSYFSKISQIRIVFDFENEFKTYLYSPTKGVLSDNNANKLRSSGVHNNYDFVKNPDEYIGSVIDYQKYLIDCYKAFVGFEKGGLNFVETDFYSTKKYFNDIVKALEKGKKLILVNGPAGSGKTILALRLLGMFKEAQLLVLNEYFDAELKAIFKKHDVSEQDLNRFYNHRKSDSTEIVKRIIACNEYEVPISKYISNFNKFVYKKHWIDKNQDGRPGKEFWQKYTDSNTRQYKEDFEEFALINKDKSFIPCSYLILDEGQRVYQETVKIAAENGLVLVVLGDMNQKLNPNTDNLQVSSDFDTSILNKDGILSNTALEEKDIEEVILEYPVRISSNALEKINYVIGATEKKTYVGEDNQYPIKIHETCDSFLNAYKKDKESRKFYCSYQDIWRYEKDNNDSVLKKKVTSVKFFDSYIRLKFSDGYEAYVNKKTMYNISNNINIKIIDMPNNYLYVKAHDNYTNRYEVLKDQNFDTLVNDDYYGISSLLKKDPTILTTNKSERSEAKDKLLFDPAFKGRMFTPYELISRECRNIYLFLPLGITIKNVAGTPRIVDTKKFGDRFYDDKSGTNYLLNQIYVLLTRAVRSVNIYCENPKLRDYFRENLRRYEEKYTLFSDDLIDNDENKLEDLLPYF